MKKIVSLGKALSFPEMIQESMKREAEAREFYETTGLCPACKKNKITKEEYLKYGIRCQECVDKTNEILKKLRGPGFMELKLEVKK